MGEKKNKDKDGPPLRKSLFLGAAFGFFLPCISFALLLFLENSFLSFGFRRLSNWLMLAVGAPIWVIYKLAKPIYDYSGDQSIIYFMTAPIFWAIWGIFFGCVTHLIRQVVYLKRNYFGENFLTERRKDIFCVFTAIGFALICIVIFTVTYLKVLVICKKTQSISEYAHKEYNRLHSLKIEKDRLKTKLIEEDRAKEATLRKDEETLLQTQSFDWESYENENLAINFSYPKSWSVKVLDIQKEEFLISIEKDDYQPVDFAIDPPAMRVLGTVAGYVPDHPNNIIGGCAYEFNSINEFCRDRCKRLNEQKAIDYRFLNRGEPVYSAVGFFTGNKKYPRVCVEFPINQFLSIQAAKSNMSVEDIVTKYKFGPTGPAAETPPEISEAVDIFDHFINSLSGIK